MPGRSAGMYTPTWNDVLVTRFLFYWSCLMIVDEVIAELARAWNAGDGAAWAASFAEDAEFVDVLGRVQRGREVIGAEHQKLFDTIYRDSWLEYWQVDNRPLGDGG